MAYEPNPFRTIVTTQDPISVMFNINERDIPILFVLKNRVLMLPDLPTSSRTGPYGEIPRCIEMQFIDHAVELASYYLNLGVPRAEVCPEIPHELFFMILDIVANLYKTNITLSDQSTADINGFTIPKNILSISKENGRTFYGKFGFRSAALDEAYTEVSTKPARDVPALSTLGLEILPTDTMQAVAQKLLFIVTSCSEEAEKDYEDKIIKTIDDFDAIIRLELRKHADFGKEISYKKKPKKYTVHIEHSDTQEGPYVVFDNHNDPHSIKKFMKICALQVGGTKRKTKLNRLKSKDKTVRMGRSFVYA